MKKKEIIEINFRYRVAELVVRTIAYSFKKAGYGNVKHIRQMVEQVTGATTIRDKQRALMEFERYKNMETFTVEGYKEKIRTTIAFWKDLGVTGVTLRNFEEFTDFLEWTRSFSGLKYKKGERHKAWQNKVKDAWNEAEGDIDTAFEIYKSNVVNV